MKDKIPKALREQVWLSHMGKKFEKKCKIVWCENKITVFDFQCGHDIPESCGGATTIENLVPICSRCNLSMSNTYTIKQWNQFSKPPSLWKRIKKWFGFSGIKAAGIESLPNHGNQKPKPVSLPSTLPKASHK
jgi:5-methylcytosine-specific restriction endonuclease McrA